MSHNMILLIDNMSNSLYANYYHINDRICEGDLRANFDYYET